MTKLFKAVDDAARRRWPAPHTVSLTLQAWHHGGTRDDWAVRVCVQGRPGGYHAEVIATLRADGPTARRALSAALMGIEADHWEILQTEENDHAC